MTDWTTSGRTKQWANFHELVFFFHSCCRDAQQKSNTIAWGDDREGAQIRNNQYIWFQGGSVLTMEPETGPGRVDSPFVEPGTSPPCLRRCSGLDLTRFAGLTRCSINLKEARFWSCKKEKNNSMFGLVNIWILARALSCAQGMQRYLIQFRSTYLKHSFFMMRKLV